VGCFIGLSVRVSESTLIIPVCLGLANLSIAGKSTRGQERATYPLAPFVKRAGMGLPLSAGVYTFSKNPLTFPRAHANVMQVICANLH